MIENWRVVERFLESKYLTELIDIVGTGDFRLNHS